MFRSSGEEVKRNEKIQRPQQKTKQRNKETQQRNTTKKHNKETKQRGKTKKHKGTNKKQYTHISVAFRFIFFVLVQWRRHSSLTTPKIRSRDGSAQAADGISFIPTATYGLKRQKINGVASQTPTGEESKSIPTSQ